MDTLRGQFGSLDPLDQGLYYDSVDPSADDFAHEDAPPPALGQDERRMQVRAYNFWAGLLDNRNFPAIDDLYPENLPEFGPHGVLLDFSRGIEDPEIAFLGQKLAGECGAAGLQITRLSDVPTRSLLSRITDHYMQILANQAPIGFEAEFVNQRGQTILYRGILLPFSSDDESIDFIFGVINWKELADSHTADELLLEIDQAIEAGPDIVPRREPETLPLTDWADGPGVVQGKDAVDHSALPRPSFGLSAQDEDAEEEITTSFHEDDPLPIHDPVSLADWLALAREMAAAAREREDRSRAALYEAIGRAYDFSLAAAQQPEEFAGMIADAGLTMQERAPMTPVVKLVFGADYDKTRLTEYAAALEWAQRNAIAPGALGERLSGAEGGLKGVVAAEREFRRMRAGVAARPVRSGPRKSTAKKLRALAPQSFASIASKGDEFALVMIRRTESGEVVVLGEVSEDASLVEKAARTLIS